MAFFSQDEDVFEGSKQHLNLSPFAYDVIHNDMFAFGEDKLSGFINTVFDYYHPIAEASIARTLNVIKDDLQNILANIPDENKTVNQIIRRILVAKKSNLTQKVNSYGKGKSFKIWLNKKNLEYLTWQYSECKEDIHYSSRGKYIKCVIEEYARLPYVEREKIYYSPVIKTIEDAIKEGCQLGIVTDSEKAYSVYPYGILCDPLSTSNYLVGHCKRYGYEADEKRPCSFRISALKSIKAERSKRAFIKESERKRLTELIASRGVQFLVGRDAEVVVKLSDSGINKYQRQVHLRPALIEKKNENIYVFQCTTAQAEFYFFKFGPDAEIISPPQLRRRMARMYEKASEIYNVCEPNETHNP